MNIRRRTFGWVGIIGCALSLIVPMMTRAEQPFHPDGVLIESAESASSLNCDANNKSPKNCDVDWSKVPPVLPFQRPGNFLIPPSGPGYYFLSDQLQGQQRPDRPRLPYGLISLDPTPAFDYDFRYLDDPKNTQTDWADCYKRIKFCDDCWLFSTGGEFRWRFDNRLNARLRDVNDSNHLLRTRVHFDLWYQDRVRVFVEGIHAESFGGNLPALRIDETGVDLLNAFAELKLGTINDAPVYVRGGRQEITLGSQRLISGLDWANTRRTFQGVRAYRYSEKLDTDLFWLQPVVPDANQFDSVTGDIDFMGIWNTYKVRPGTAIDFYALNLSDRRPTTIGEVVTVGARCFGDIEGQLLWDLEGAGQVGKRAGQDVGAAMGTAGAGWHFKDLPWDPVLWAYYDYASGDSDPNDGRFGTFNQLFPFGHYYLGFIDLVGRQNIHDLNFHLITNPTPWMIALAQFHIFDLASARAPLFDAAGVPIAFDPTGNSGRDVGNELDLLVNFRLTPHQHLLVGYSKLFAGSFLTANGVNRSPEFFYVQYNMRW